jgi:hypothetical protein
MKLIYLIARNKRDRAIQDARTIPVFIGTLFSRTFIEYIRMYIQYVYVQNCVPGKYFRMTKSSFHFLYD